MSSAAPGANGLTFVEKVYARTSGLPVAHAGDRVTITPDRILAYDWPGYIETLVGKSQQLTGSEQPADPSRLTIFVDHMVSKGDADEEILHRPTIDWARRNGVAVFERQGIGHQVAAEIGFGRPGDLVVHFDPHVSALGASGAIGVGLYQQILEPWATGRLSTVVPASARVTLVGELADGTDARDVLHTLIKRYGADGFVGLVIEFCGAGVANLGLTDRQNLCAMITFTGASSAVVHPMYLGGSGPTVADGRDLTSDVGARYACDVSLDLATLAPMVARPGSSDEAHIVDVGELADQKIDRAYIGSCSSGRIDELRQAARLLRGRRVAPGVELIVVPTSERIARQAEREGIVDDLTSAGATVTASSCDYCFGYAGPLGDGVVAISSGVTNARGRMGSPSSEIYLASALTVAACALAGRIADPRQVLGDKKLLRNADV